LAGATPPQRHPQSAEESREFSIARRALPALIAGTSHPEELACGGTGGPRRNALASWRVAVTLFSERLEKPPVSRRPPESTRFVAAPIASLTDEAGITRSIGFTGILNNGIGESLFCDFEDQVSFPSRLACLEARQNQGRRADRGPLQQAPPRPRLIARADQSGQLRAALFEPACGPSRAA